MDKEIITVVIWVVIAFLGSVINALSKRRSQDDEQPEEETPSEASPRPVIINIPPPTHQTEPEKRESAPQKRVVTGKNIPIPRKSIPITPKKFTPRYSQISPQTNTEPSKRDVRSTRTKQEPALAEKQPKTTQEFDLERAIIYSEILKPKFQEYE